MKILFYIHALAGGGAERVWSIMASSFAARGHEVILAVDYEAAENRSFVSPAVRVVVLGGGHATSVHRLQSLLRRDRPDVAVSALAAANVKLVAAAALSGFLGRTVLSYHGYADTEPQRLSVFGYRSAVLLTRLAVRTVAVSDGLAAYMQKRWNTAADRMTRIYNPVAVRPGGATTRAELEARPPVFLAAGRFVSYKNFAGLLQAFAALERSDARLIILGDGPERSALIREITRLGLGSRVEMPGYVPDPWTWFDRARCFVLTSKREPFGLVLVEAMARGLDVIATDCDGPREILAQGEYGTLVPVGETAALTAAMDRALRAPSDPETRIARARTFDVATAVDQYEALFRTVVSGGSVTPVACLRSREAGPPPLAATRG